MNTTTPSPQRRTFAQVITDGKLDYLTYDFRARQLRRRGKPFDLEVAEKNLLTLKSVFDRHGITFWVVYGTCLGAVRDGGFIPHDTDTDVAVFASDKDKIVAAIPDLVKEGMIPIRTKHPDDLLTFMRDDEYIDIGLFSRFRDSEGIDYWAYQNNRIYGDHYDKFDEIAFLGERFRVPQRVDAYLASLYGPGWKVPAKNRPAGTPQSLAEFRPFSNLLSLADFFRDMPAHVVLKLSEDFPSYYDHSDIDVLCADRAAVLSHIVAIGRDYERRGFRIKKEENDGHLHVDFYAPGTKRLNFRFDLLESVNAYSKLTVTAEFTHAVLDGRVRKDQNGVAVQVPALAHDLALRFLEYVEWKDERPDKIKHWEHIQKVGNYDFVEVVNRFTDLEVRLDLKEGAVNLTCSRRPRTTLRNVETAPRDRGRVESDFAAKRYAEAAEQYCALLVNRPDDAAMLVRLGECLVELQDVAAAYWCFARAATLEPANPSVAQARDRLAAVCSIELAGSVAAGASFIEALLNATLVFCNDRLNRQDFPAAWQALGRAVELAPKSAEIRVHRGRLALFLNDADGAVQDFSEALRLDERCASAHAGLARLFLRCEKPTEAEAAAERALRIDAKEEEALQVKAECIARLVMPPADARSAYYDVPAQSPIPELGALFENVFSERSNGTFVACGSAAGEIFDAQQALAARGWKAVRFGSGNSAAARIAGGSLRRALKAHRVEPEFELLWIASDVRGCGLLSTDALTEWRPQMIIIERASLEASDAAELYPGEYFQEHQYLPVHQKGGCTIYVAREKLLAPRTRMDCFLVWGHGIRHCEDILGRIRARSALEIIAIHRRGTGDLTKFVQDLYACDTVPFEHLRAKTRYLLTTPEEVIFVLVRNHQAQEKHYGDGAFRHVQCALIKDVKEEIRNAWNPRVNGKRTEDHVIHATDYEAQVAHTMKVLGLPTPETYLRQSSRDYDLPYHLGPVKDCREIEIPLDHLRARILGQSIVPIEQTPHYRFVAGDRAPYLEYLERHFGRELTDDHSAGAFDRLLREFEYGRPGRSGKPSLLVVRQIQDVYVLQDGVHRAAILKYRGVSTVRVLEMLSKTTSVRPTPDCSSRDTTAAARTVHELRDHVAPSVQKDRWEHHLSEEVSYWEGYIRSRGYGKYAEELNERLRPDSALQATITDTVMKAPGDVVRILDVGAGPLTWLGKRWEGRILELTPVDPLADQYNEILRRHGVNAPVPTQRADAEKLSSHFPLNYFDVAHARNSIDHSYDAAHAIEEMLAVTKPGGWVILGHGIRESTAQNGAGLHQWDFFSADGDFVIEGRQKQSINLTRRFAGVAEVHCEVLREKQWLRVCMRKLVPSVRIKAAPILAVAAGVSTEKSTFQLAIQEAELSAREGRLGDARAAMERALRLAPSGEAAARAQEILALLHSEVRAGLPSALAVAPVVVRLMGGLGNQMFQYATGLALARKHQAPLKLDLTFLQDRTIRPHFTLRDYALNVFPLDAGCALLRESTDIPTGLKRVKEKHFHFDQAVVDQSAGIFLEGYWQSPRYFETVAEDLRESFKLNPEMSEADEALAARIAATECAVCLHVRRGDMVKDSVTASVHGSCSLDYYRSACDEMARRFPSVHFFIFSDDPHWCESVDLTRGRPHSVASRHGSAETPAIDLALMRMCRHFITANSTFSWWAAYLGSSPEKIVIVPDPWFTDPSIDTSDLFPKEWIHLSRNPGPVQAELKAAPMVSVIVPCYKQAHYLPTAVASVVAQTLSDWELIIVDDGSPDDTSQVARELIACYPERRIRLLEKPNGGLADARNAGIGESLGRYVLPLDADDRIAPEMLRKTVQVLESDPNVAIAYTDMARFGAITGILAWPEYDFRRLLVHNQLGCCSLFRREAWAAVGGYNVNMRLGYEDWDFWVGCGEKGFFGKRVPEPLFLYRVKDASMYTKALEHDRELHAQIVMNHPRLYDEAIRREAAKILTADRGPEAGRTVVAERGDERGDLEHGTDPIRELRIRARQSVTEGNWAEAAEICAKAVYVSRDDLEILHIFAHALANLDALEDALKVAKRLVALRPQEKEFTDLITALEGALARPTAPGRAQAHEPARAEAARLQPTGSCRPSSVRVLFATGSPAAYMAPPRLGDEQIVCGPDWKDERGPDGQWISLQTPLGEYDLAAIAKKLPASQQPDLVVCLVDSSWRNKPRNLGAFRAPVVLLVADTHHMDTPITGMLRYAASERFDRIVFLYDRHHVPIFRSAGLQNLYWLPGLTFPHEDATVREAAREKRVKQIAFVGQAGQFHPRRARLLSTLRDRRLPIAHKQVSQRAGLELYGSSLIGLNVSLNGDLNLRIMEILASGSMLLTDRLAPASGLLSLWNEGRDLVTFGSPEELVDRAHYYLAHPKEARAIGRAGTKWFTEHFHAARRRDAFLRLAFDGESLPEFGLPAEPPLRISFPCDRPGGGLEALDVYENIQELHRILESVHVSMDATVPDDLVRLCETLPRVRITRDETLPSGVRPQWRIIGASAVKSLQDTEAPCLWCWDRPDAPQNLPCIEEADRSVEAPLVRAQLAGEHLLPEGDSNEKKILFYTDESTGGGVAHYNHAILCALAERGWRAFGVQPPNSSTMLQQQKAAGIKHQFLSYEPRLDFARSFVDTEDAERVILPAQPDLICFSDCSPVSNIAAKHVAIANGIPFVSIVHSGAAYLADRFPNCLKVVRQQFAEAREVVSVSKTSQDVLRRVFGLASDKGVVIPNGRPPEYFAVLEPAERARIRTELDVPENAVVCLTSARFDPGKGYQHQLLAIKHLQAKKLLGQLYFLWAGDGPVRAELEAAVKAHRLQDRVRFLGERGDIPRLLGASDIFVFTSLSEAMPLCVLEAMAQGLPVAATAVGGIPEELGETGMLLPDPNVDPGQMAIKLIETLQFWSTDPALRKKIGAAARQRAERLFREETMIARTLELIDEVTSATADAVCAAG